MKELWKWLDKIIKKESISYNFLGIGAEEVGRWSYLGGIYFCIWKFSKMCYNNFLLHCKKLIKIQSLLPSQFLNNFVISLWLLKTFPILLRTDKSMLRFIRLEYFPHHEYLFLCETLIKVKLHFKIRIYFNFLWLAWSHVRWQLIRKWIIIFYYF